MTYSPIVSFRCPKEIHGKLLKLAAKQDRSVSYLIKMFLKEALKGKKC